MNIYNTHSLIVICPDALRGTMISIAAVMTPPFVPGFDQKLWGPRKLDNVDDIHWADVSRASPTICDIMMGINPPNPMPQGVTAGMIDVILSQCYVAVIENIDQSEKTQYQQYKEMLEIYSFVEYVENNGDL